MKKKRSDKSKWSPDPVNCVQVTTILHFYLTNLWPDRRHFAVQYVTSFFLSHNCCKKEQCMLLYRQYVIESWKAFRYEPVIKQHSLPQLINVHLINYCDLLPNHHHASDVCSHLAFSLAVLLFNLICFFVSFIFMPPYISFLCYIYPTSHFIGSIA